jgi:signal transduction histidine kinase/ActR/RegA family two-component response regulator
VVFRLVLLSLCLWAASLGVATAAPPALGAAGSSEAVELARFVEARAARTSFAELEAFGRAAEQRHDREGLNRLYHVTWTILNQGEFDRALVWNDRLARAARRQHDARYIDIAALNALTARYDQGDAAVAGRMADYVRHGRDWFVRAHAARLTAITLMDQGEVGHGLQLLTRAQADVPERDPYAATALAGIWEVVGLGLRDIDDVEGAAAAFRKFEIDYSNPLYPRPDFDSLYNLTKMAVRVGDLDRAERLYQAHHRVAGRSDLKSLHIYDAALCATVADARGQSRQVLACLDPYGEDLGEAAFVPLDALPLRAVARARTGQLAGARRDLAKLRGLEDQAGEDSTLRYVEAEVLFAEGRPEAAYRLLRDYMADSRVISARAFGAGVHQVTGDMQQQLAERRVQLDTARSYTRLQQAMIVIGVIFLISVVVGLLWQLRQGRRLKLAQARAEAANRAKSEFLANMSHEIRTPLNGVVSMADALSRRPLDAQEHQMVELIRSSGDTLERLLTDILDSAKIEAGQVDLEPTVFDLGHAIDDVALLWRAKAEDKGVALELRVDPGTPRWVEGDAVRLRQVLTNLVSNALKFTEAGAVTLSVEPRPDGRVAFQVRDTGVGFDGEQKGRIFQRFQQADGSITRRFGGTGLGLTISSALVELMGGELDCDSTAGQGSVFFFDLPLPTAQAPVASGAAVVEADGLGAAPIRILLADDHPANRKVVEIMLAATVVELVAVEDGRQAVEAFAEGGFDLVLMDMQMPVMDGLTATRAIRTLEAEQGLRRTPILMLTANAMAEHVEAGRQAGADGHLTKPITLTALLTAMGDALSADGRRDAA